MSADAYEMWRAWARENCKWSDAEIDEFLATRESPDKWTDAEIVRDAIAMTAPRPMRMSETWRQRVEETGRKLARMRADADVQWPGRLAPPYADVDTPLELAEWLAATEQHLRALLDVITRQGGYLRDEDLIAVQHARHHLEQEP